MATSSPSTRQALAAAAELEDEAVAAANEDAEAGEETAEPDTSAEEEASADTPAAAEEAASADSADAADEDSGDADKGETDISEDSAEEVVIPPDSILGVMAEDGSSARAGTGWSPTTKTEVQFEPSMGSVEPTAAELTPGRADKRSVSVR